MFNYQITRQKITKLLDIREERGHTSFFIRVFYFHFIFLSEILNKNSCSTNPGLGVPSELSWSLHCLYYSKVLKILIAIIIFVKNATI